MARIIAIATSNGSNGEKKSLCKLKQARKKNTIARGNLCVQIKCARQKNKHTHTHTHIHLKSMMRKCCTENC